MPHYSGMPSHLLNPPLSAQVSQASIPIYATSALNAFNRALISSDVIVPALHFFAHSFRTSDRAILQAQGGYRIERSSERRTFGIAVGRTCHPCRIHCILGIVFCAS